MDFKQIQELIKLVNKTNVGEIRIEEKDFKLVLKSKDFIDSKSRSDAIPYKLPLVSPTDIPTIKPQMESQQPPTEKKESASEAIPETSSEEGEKEGFQTIKSPMIGTFYRSPAPEKDPYIKVGDMIAAGDVVCTIEAMKLFNEIESEISGKIIKVLVENAAPVEYDQPLFTIEVD